MVAFPDNTCPRSGQASLAVRLVDGVSAVPSCCAFSPLRILLPRPSGLSVWACVAGELTRLDLDLGPGSRCFLGTQSSNKVYRNPARLPCSHVTRAVLAAGSVLVFAPDPVQAFAGSRYSQRQEFHLEAGASLALLDWFSSGRAARGERWHFDRLQCRNDVFLGPRRVLVDSVLLDAEDGELAAAHRGGRWNCFASLVLLGPALEELAATMLAAWSTRSVEPKASLIGAASPVRGGTLLRLAGTHVEEVGRELRRHLSPLSTVLGDDPWARKW